MHPYTIELSYAAVLMLKMQFAIWLIGCCTFGPFVGERVYAALRREKETDKWYLAAIAAGVSLLFVMVFPFVLFEIHA